MSIEDTGSGWEELLRLTASDGTAGDQFGMGAIEGDLAIVDLDEALRLLPAIELFLKQAFPNS